MDPLEQPELSVTNRPRSVVGVQFPIVGIGGNLRGGRAITRPLSPSSKADQVGAVEDCPADGDGRLWQVGVNPPAPSCAVSHTSRIPARKGRRAETTPAPSSADSIPGVGRV